MTPNGIIIKFNNLYKKYRLKDKILKTFKREFPALKLSDFVNIEKYGKTEREIIRKAEEKGLQFFFFRDYGIIKRPMKLYKDAHKTNSMNGLYIELKVLIPIDFWDDFMAYIGRVLEGLNLDDNTFSDIKLEDAYSIIVTHKI